MERRRTPPAGLWSLAFLAASLGAGAGLGASFSGGATRQVEQGEQGERSSDADEDGGEPERDGRWLYLRNCAGCHGETGDGKGETMLQLGEEARSFAEGGFAFGNTPEQMFKTVTSGIPGRSRMPGFESVLSEEERRLVVDYVRTLMPPEPPDEVSGSVMLVGPRPAIARGMLPPIAEGAPERVRGLLIGLPEGLTFEYRIDDVRLLGVRQGPFADRTDWGGRGGGHLKPLGQAVYLFEGGDPRPTFHLRPPGAIEAAGGGAEDLVPGEPLAARIASTWIRGGRAGVDYGLLREDGAEVARVQEECAVRGTSVGPALVRRFTLRASGAPADLVVAVAGSGRVGWIASLEAVTAGGSGPLRVWATSEAAEEGGVEAVLLELPDDGLTAGPAGDGMLAISVRLALRPAELAATIVQAPEWSDELRERLTAELLP